MAKTTVDVYMQKCLAQLARPSLSLALAKRTRKSIQVPNFIRSVAKRVRIRFCTLLGTGWIRMKRINCRSIYYPIRSTFLFSVNRPSEQVLTPKHCVQLAPR